MVQRRRLSDADPRSTGSATRITAAQARRIAIAAQGLHRRRPTPAQPGHAPTRRNLRSLVDRIGVLQLDSVNVLARAHYLPVFSRLGGYPPGLLENAAWPQKPKDRLLIESWAHVASLVPIELEPMLRFRQAAMAQRWRPHQLIDEHPGLLERIREVITDQGPVSAGGIEKVLEAPGKGRPGWWEWSATKRLVEYLFVSGQVAVAGRRSFERLYADPDRVIPEHIRAVPTPDRDDAIRHLVALAARHHGIGTVADLADYYRLPNAATSTALDELVEEGVVVPVTVTGWNKSAWMHVDAARPRVLDGAALLCPFDPLIWFRDRTQRLFDVHYRIEIYVPQAQRVHGYFVFPLLVGDAIVGRFDLKADRAEGRLLVQSSWLEEGADPAMTAEAAAGELVEMAGWLGLSAIEVFQRGDLASRLRAAVRAVGRAVS